MKIFAYLPLILVLLAPFLFLFGALFVLPWLLHLAAHIAGHGALGSFFKGVGHGAHYTLGTPK